MDKTRRGNYNSGEDFVLEYGELRFTFNEDDFAERCEQAALKLGFVGGRLGEDELEDLVNLAVNGDILDPASALGEHVNECWAELVGPAERSLVHWLRRLVFRGAWLDQRVNEGELGRRAACLRRPADPHRPAAASRSSSRPSPRGAASRTCAGVAPASCGVLGRSRTEPGDLASLASPFRPARHAGWVGLNTWHRLASNALEASAVNPPEPRRAPW